MAYSRRSTRRSSYGRGSFRGASRYSRPARRNSYVGRGRRAGFGRGSSEIRLVIQTPSDMLPQRPKVGQFARLRRRARY